MKISVIIPTYRPGDYIWDCFESLQNQSSSLDSFEVVVVLNGENEPYCENIETYLKNSQLHYKLICTHEIGVSKARNVGIDYAINKYADYILFLDDDDRLSPSFIADCLSKANPNHIVVCNSKTFRNNTDNVFGDDYIAICFTKNKNRIYYNFSFRCFFSSVCAKLIPSRIIGDTRFCSKFSNGEDSLFGFEIFKKNIHCILSEEDTIYYRRLRSDSASRRKANNTKRINNNFKLIFAYSKVFLKNPTEYSTLFFMSRLAAEVKCIINTVFER